jgi:phosphohistidine phosphatase SixA
MRLDAASLRADARLYLASPDALLQALAKIPDAAHRVLLVAHNPAVSELAAALGTNARSRALATAEFRHFALPVEQWRELRESS